MLKALLHTIVLPDTISDFERSYLRRMNRVGLYFFALHIPVFMLVAYFNGTGTLMAAALTLASRTARSRTRARSRSATASRRC
jgi:two-component system, chemotaxis family, sensor kinase CheA